MSLRRHCWAGFYRNRGRHVSILDQSPARHRSHTVFEWNKLTPTVTYQVPVGHARIEQYPRAVHVVARYWRRIVPYSKRRFRMANSIYIVVTRANSFELIRSRTCTTMKVTEYKCVLPRLCSSSSSSSTLRSPFGAPDRFKFAANQRQPQSNSSRSAASTCSNKSPAIARMVSSVEMERGKETVEVCRSTFSPRSVVSVTIYTFRDEKYFSVYCDTTCAMSFLPAIQTRWDTLPRFRHCSLTLELTVYRYRPVDYSILNT